MYKIERDSVRRLSDNASIPTAKENTDYQQYLAWLAEGNTPLPPDPPGREELNAPILAQLEEVDRKSIRGLREWVAKQADAPKELVECEISATAEREKLEKEP